MKIILTGGDTGGHFYPIIAVAEQLRKIQKEEGVTEMKIFFVSTHPYDKKELERLGITFKKIQSGKLRTYPSIQTVFDIFRTFFGIFQSLFFIFLNYPDVVFGKGGFPSFPVLLVAKTFRIPIIIHESDSVPGRVNKWAGKSAQQVFVSFKEAIASFPKEKTELAGRPIVEGISDIENIVGAREFLHIHDENVPVLLVLGGSQGSEKINSIIIDSLLKLTEKYYIIHQTGRNNIVAVRAASESILKRSPYADRYKPFDFLDREGIRRAESLSDLVLSRAGSTLFEIAAWGKAGILVPYEHAHGNHQHHNAFAYARAGACRVIEEYNLSTSVLMLELEDLFQNPQKIKSMEDAAKAFHRPSAAEKVAYALAEIGLLHEK